MNYTKGETVWVLHFGRWVRTNVLGRDKERYLVQDLEGEVWESRAEKMKSRAEYVEMALNE